MSKPLICNEYIIEIAMPNEIFQDINDWSNQKIVKSIMHKEVIYSYYWLIVYLWRYCLYYSKDISQSTIKETLGYNPQDKRINYIMKKNGLLDQKEYTETFSDFPVSWSLVDGELSFVYLREYDDITQEMIKSRVPKRNIIKRPLLHTGDDENEGIFWNSSNTHFMSSYIFEVCMSNSGLGCAGFYLYGILKSMYDKNKFHNNEEFFSCSNETLVKITGWGVDRVTTVTNNLTSAKLIEKEQRIKLKGNVNHYGVL